MCCYVPVDIHQVVYDTVVALLVLTHPGFKSVGCVGCVHADSLLLLVHHNPSIASSTTKTTERVSARKQQKEHTNALPVSALQSINPQAPRKRQKESVHYNRSIAPPAPQKKHTKCGEDTLVT